jgi:DNA topoisomerase IB
MKLSPALQSDARIVRRCQALPGQELFHLVDDKGEVQNIGSEDVNAYLDACCKGKNLHTAYETL